MRGRPTDRGLRGPPGGANRPVPHPTTARGGRVRTPRRIYRLSLGATFDAGARLVRYARTAMSDHAPPSTAAEAPTAEPEGHEGWRTWVPHAAPTVIAAWLATRALVAVSFALAHALAPRVRLPLGRLHLDEGLLFWDAQYYRSIAEHGYGGSSPDTVRFFPGFPVLARALGPLFAGHLDVALVVLANVSTLVALFLLWRIVAELGYDERIAERSVVLLSVFPAAGVTAFGYAEGLFLLFGCAATLFIIRGRPWHAVVPLFMVGLIRPTGILLALPVAVTAFIEWRRSGRVPFRWAPAAASAVLGQAVFLIWISSTGAAWTAPLDYQRDYRAGFREPITRLFGAARDIIGGDLRDVYNLGFAVVMIVALIVAVRRQLPVAWNLYLAAGLLVACSANNIDSLGRYAMLLVPVWVIAISLIGSDHERSKLAYGTIVVASSAGLVLFTTEALLGRVIP